MLSTNGVEDVIMIEICIPRILHVRIESSDDEQSVRDNYSNKASTQLPNLKLRIRHRIKGL